MLPSKHLNKACAATGTSEIADWRWLGGRRRCGELVVFLSERVLTFACCAEPFHSLRRLWAHDNAIDSDMPTEEGQDIPRALYSVGLALCMRNRAHMVLQACTRLPACGKFELIQRSSAWPCTKDITRKPGYSEKRSEKDREEEEEEHKNYRDNAGFAGVRELAVELMQASATRGLIE
jgi:hypothetical protein